MAYVFCNQCGHRNPPDSSFCSSCGSALDSSGDRTITLDRGRSAAGRARRRATTSSCRWRDLPARRRGAHRALRRRRRATASRSTTDVTRLGRHPDSEIMLDDITVSRRHAAIERTDEGYVVTDAGSLNGTYVNQERIDGPCCTTATSCRSASSASCCSSAPMAEPGAGPPVDRRGARAAARGVPRRHDLQDPLPREPGPDRARAHAVGVPQVLRRRRRAAARDPARAARELPAAAGDQGPHRLRARSRPPRRRRRRRRRSRPAEQPTAGRSVARPPGRRGRRRPRAAASPTPSPRRRRPARRRRRRRRDADRRPAARLLPGVLVNRDELCAMASVTPDQLAAARGVRRRRRSAPGPASCTATTPSRSPPPPAGSCAPASTPATCGPGGRRSSARPGCTSSSILPLLRQRNPQARGQAAAPARRARRARRPAAGGDDARRAAPVPRLTARRAAPSPAAAAPPAGTIGDVVPLELVGVRVEVPANTPMVLLREQTGRHRLLPIYIGTPEATAIHYALEGVDAAAAADPRPVRADARPSSACRSSRSSSPRCATTRTSPSCTCAAPRATSPCCRAARPTPSPSPCAARRRCFASEELLDEVGQEPAAGARGGGRGDHRRVPRLHRARQPRRLRRLTLASSTLGSLAP